MTRVFTSFLRSITLLFRRDSSGKIPTTAPVTINMFAYNFLKMNINSEKVPYFHDKSIVSITTCIVATKHKSKLSVRLNYQSTYPGPTGGNTDFKICGASSIYCQVFSFTFMNGPRTTGIVKYVGLVFEIRFLIPP